MVYAFAVNAGSIHNLKSQRKTVKEQNHKSKPKTNETQNPAINLVIKINL